jgi:integrase
MKAKEPHTVYLFPPAVAILKGQGGQDPAVMFPTPRAGHEGTPMSDMSMLTLLTRAGLRSRTTVHGLCRKTFSTWANETGAARADVIEAALAHEESNRVRAAYNLATYNDERRALMHSWAEYLKHSAHVLQLPRRAA